MTNMMSVVSSVSAKVLFPTTDLNTVYFPGLSGKNQDAENNSAKGRTDPGEGTLSAQRFGVVPAETGHLQSSLTTFRPQGLHELPQLSPQHL